MPLEQHKWVRRDTIAITFVTATAGAMRGIHLTRPGVIVFDEFFYAREACFYVYRSQEICGVGPRAISPHPPFGKWLISLGIRAFGNDPLGWRIAGLLAGILTIVLLYLLARRLSGSTLGATAAAGLLAIDPLHFVQSRVAMLDVFVTLFVLASFLFLAIDRQPDRTPESGGLRPPGILSRPWLLAAGLAAGAAAATKWIGFLALTGIAGLSLQGAVTRQGSGPWRDRFRRAVRNEGWTLFAALVIVAFAVYVLSFVGRIEGATLAPPWAHGSWIRNFLGVQKGMLSFHLRIRDVSPYTSPAWSWPLIRRPVVYFQASSGGHYRKIMAMGSPLVWWTSLAALAYLGVRRAGPDGSTEASVVVLTGFAALYAPWLIANGARSFTFLFYLLPAVPFMCLALATVATRLVGSFPGRALVATFSVVAVALFVFFYPVLTAAPLSKPELEARVWFRDCQPPSGRLASDGWCWR